MYSIKFWGLVPCIGHANGSVTFAMMLYVVCVEAMVLLSLFVDKTQKMMEHFLTKTKKRLVVACLSMMGWW